MSIEAPENMWLVSVIIPVYNVERCLKKCLDSVINQTYSNLEIIMIDDGSNDNSGTICDDYARLDKRIKVIHNKNAGVSNARNTGIEICKGEFVAFIDSDDYVDNSYIQCLVEPQKKKSYDLVLCNYLDYYVDNARIDNHLLTDDELCKLSGDFHKDYNVFKQLMWYPVLKLYKMEIINDNNLRFPEDLTDGEDQYFNFLYYENVNEYCYINQALYTYCHWPSQSLSRKKTLSSYISNIKKLKKEKEFLKSLEIYKYENILIDSAFIIIRRYSISKGNGFKDFKLRTKEVLDIVKNELDNVKELSFKRKVLKICLKNRLFFIIYLYYLLRHWLLKE